MKNKLTTSIFFNHCFDKRRFQNFLYWFFKKSHSGQSRLLNFLEKLKFLGFHSATQAGFSISIDDLKIPSSKSEILLTAENIVLNADIQLLSGNLTIIERYQRIIEIWNRTSEELKYQVLQSFKISDFLNPVYLMAFSGARGNISQIRQLVGMRGLMADPQGQIIDFPIRSNFREGLTLTEYLISCSGARKGIVDTALRTAASGYLTRRLVDVAHHVIINQIDCQMNGAAGSLALAAPFGGPVQQPHSQFGIWIEDLYDQQKKILSLQQRLVGRVLAETIIPQASSLIIGQKDHEISKITSQEICKYRKKVLIRSPLTCQSSKFICQLCYGWNLAEGQLVSVGEAVGVLAAQSIGEPGTQMTMRTFHTGGVFTGILMDQTYAPFSGIVHYNFSCNGLLIRTLQGKIAYLSKNNGILSIFQDQKAKSAQSSYKHKAVGSISSPQRAFCFILKKLYSKFYKYHYSSLKITHSHQNINFEIQNHLTHKLQQKRLTSKGPLSNYKTLLHQLKRLNFQLKKIIFFNPIGLNNENDTNLNFLKKRDINQKNKLENNSNFLKIYKKKGPSSKNLMWSTRPKMEHHLKSQYRIPLKLQKQIQFIFQTFTILYVRQNENVLKKQLIAELPFFENEKSLENEQEILSNESGEIYFGDFVLLEKTISDFKNEIQFKKNFVQDLGGFWILFGRSFQHILMMEKSSANFLKKLDLIDQNVPFSQIQVQSHNFLNNEIDDLFYKNNFLQLEQIFLSSFSRKININYKSRTFKQKIRSYRFNHDEYTLILKRYSQTFQINSIFFKRFGYLQIPNQVFPRKLQVWTRMRGASLVSGMASGKSHTRYNKPRETTSLSTNQNKNLNFIKKIQIFNGIEPISINFLDKNKVFWNYRKNYQRHFETWMIGLQGQSKYINKYSDFRNQFIKISIKHFQINFLKQNSFKFKNLHQIQYIPNRLVSSNFQLILNNIFSSLSFQKQKINFFLSDTGRIFKKSKKIYCEFQNLHLLEKYKRSFINLRSDPVILKNQFDRTFLAKSEKFFLNIKLEGPCGLLFVNRQGSFQSFGQKVLKNTAYNRDSFPNNPIKSGSTPRQSRGLKDNGIASSQTPRISEKKRILRKKINEFLLTLFQSSIFIPLAVQGAKKHCPGGSPHSFRIGTQISWYTKTRKQIYKIHRHNPNMPRIRQIFNSFFPSQQDGGSVDYYSRKFNFDVIKIQSIFCNLFLKQSRLFQNLPKNWARQIRNIQPRIIHWKNLPNQKYMFLLNFLAYFESTQYIEQKNLNEINDYRQISSELDARLPQGLVPRAAQPSPQRRRSPFRGEEIQGGSLRSMRSPQGFINNLRNKYHHQSRLNSKNTKTYHFREQYPKKCVFKQKWIYLDLDPPRKAVRPFGARGKPAMIGLQWIGILTSKNQTKNLLNIDFATQMVTWDRMMICSPWTNNQRIFQIQQYNFWKIQQRQEIIGYQKLKIGFYSFIRIFFSMQPKGCPEDLKWMNILNHPRAPVDQAGNGTLNLLKKSVRFGARIILFPTLTIFPKLLTNIKQIWTLLPFDRTKHFFKTLKFQRSSQKYDYTRFRFRQKIPQIFSIDDQKHILMKFIVNKKSWKRSRLGPFWQAVGLPSSPTVGWRGTGGKRQRAALGPKGRVTSAASRKALLASSEGAGKPSLASSEGAGECPPAGELGRRSEPFSFSYFFIQNFSEIYFFFVQKHTNKQKLSHIPYKTFLNIQKNKKIKSENNKMEENISNTCSQPPESTNWQKIGVIQCDPQVNISKKRRQMLTKSPQLWTSKLTNFLHYHQQIFYGKFKKNFQNIHLNSSDGLTSLLEMGLPLEDQCIQWQFFGDWTIILEKNIYSTYFKHFSQIQDNLNKCGGTWHSGKEPLPEVPSAGSGLMTADLKNQFCTMYPSINKVLTSRLKIRLFDVQEQTRPEGIDPHEEPPSGAVPEAEGVGLLPAARASEPPQKLTLDRKALEFHLNNIEIPTTKENRSMIIPAISLNEKYLFDNILPKSLIRSVFGILKMPKGPFYNKMDSLKLQKWILDNYFDSYLLIVQDFYLLKNFESRFFQSRPKKPIYNKFYYYDNKIETELTSEYTKQMIVKKNKLQENIIRKYSISNIHKKLMNSKCISTLFSNSIKPLTTEFNTIVNFVEKPSNQPQQQLLHRDEHLQDFFELPSNLYNFYIEYISKKSSQLKYGFYQIKNLYKMNMKTWLNSLKNFQKYSSRYLKSQIISKQPLRPLFVKNQDLLQKDITKISGLRYQKYLRVFMASFLQKLEAASEASRASPWACHQNSLANTNNTKQYCFVLKFYQKNLDNFYSINFNHYFFSQQNRKSFRIPFLGLKMTQQRLSGSKKGTPTTHLFLNNCILKPNIDICQTTLNFQTYEIFKIFISIFLDYQKSISIKKNVNVFKLFQKKNKLNASFRQSRLNYLFNLISLTLQAEFLKNFLLQSRLKYQIPLFDKKFEIFLVSIIPIIDARASKDRGGSLRSPQGRNDASPPQGARPEGPSQCDSLRSPQGTSCQTYNKHGGGGTSLLKKLAHSQPKAWLNVNLSKGFNPFVNNLSLVDNYTHSLKIHITKTKHFNFLTQKYLTAQAKKYFCQNRAFSLTSLNLLSLSKVISQQFSSLQFEKNQTKKNFINFQIIKKSFLNSSEIQIFIRFFLPFHSGEIIDPLFNKQGSQIVLFANVSDFFSYRQDNQINFIRSHFLNYDHQVILEQKLNYFLENKFLGRIQKTNIHTFLLKNPSNIFYRLQLQKKNKWYRDVLSIISNFKCIKFSQKNKIYKFKSNLDCLNKLDFQLPIQQRIKKNKNSFKTQQLCISQKIFYSYKFSQNLNYKIWAFMDPILTKNVRSSFQYFTNLNMGFGSIDKQQGQLDGPGGSKAPVHHSPAPSELASDATRPRAPKAQAFRKSWRKAGCPAELQATQLTATTINHSLAIKLGSFMRGGSRWAPQRQFHFQGGQLIAKTQHILLFRKATTHLLNDQSILHIQHGDMIFKNQPLYSVFYNQSKTGDIVQGIPKIEEIFEARKKSKYSLHELPIFSKDFLFFEKIIIKYLRSLQKSVVNNIQRIYCGQGIHISDKHIEIIVRQMTSNVLILEPGQTGLLYGEIVALQWISQINTISNQVIYEPVLMGMTKTCLETSNFLSAASFQETTRILGRAALQNQIDFIRGLKQNVILGNLIPIGTGCF